MTSPQVDIDDPRSLTQYLVATGRTRPGEALSIQILSGGVSNKTVLVERPDGEAWVLKQALPKLRVKADWFSDPVRIRQEALALRWLPQLTPPGTITPLVFEDESAHLLAMEAVPRPHVNWKTLLLAGRVEKRHVERFGQVLGRMHRTGHERRNELTKVFDERRFFETLRLEPYYAYSAQNRPEAEDFLNNLIESTRSRRLTVVHGDYSPKNVLIAYPPAIPSLGTPGEGEGGGVRQETTPSPALPRSPGRGGNEGGDSFILLDHEVIHFGDPAFDLGFALTHLLSKANHLVEHRSTFAAAANLFWNSYTAELSGVPWRQDLEAHAVRHTLGCLLARVAGRSPLEYLSPQAAGWQAERVILLMRTPPATVSGLVERFLA